MIPINMQTLLTENENLRFHIKRYNTSDLIFDININGTVISLVLNIHEQHHTYMNNINMTDCGSKFKGIQQNNIYFK